MKNKLWLWLPLLVLIALSVILRAHLIRERPLAGRGLNEDAAAHVLAQCLSYHEYPFSVHHGIPIANLRGEQPIPDSQFVGKDRTKQYLADDRGHTYYSSFPPLAFLAVNTVFQVAGVEPNLLGLRVLNVVLQILTCAAFGYLVWTIAPEKTDARTKAIVTATGGCLFFFCTETLRSYTFSHWAQQWHLPMLFLVIAQAAKQRFNWVYYINLMLGCLVEWSAFTLGIGCAAMLLWHYAATRERRFLIHLLLTSAGLTLAGIALLAWFNMVVPWQEFIHFLRTRSSSRSILSHPQLHLIPVVYLSAVLSTVIPVAAILAAKIWDWKNGHSDPSRSVSESKASSQAKWPALKQWLLGPQGTTVVLFCFALLENVLILQHVMEYTYDRLKFVGLYCAVAAMILYSLRSQRVRSLLVGLIYAVSLASLVYYVWLWDWSQDYSQLEYQRYERLAAAIRETCPPDIKPYMANYHKNTIAFLAQRVVERIDETIAMPSLGKDEPHPTTIADRPALVAELRTNLAGQRYRAFRYYYLDREGKAQFEEFPVAAQ